MSSTEQLWCGFLVTCVAKDENRKILMKDLNTVNCNSFHFLIIRFGLMRFLVFHCGGFPKGRNTDVESGCHSEKTDINWDIPQTDALGADQAEETGAANLLTSAHQNTSTQVAAKATDNMKQVVWSRLHHIWWNWENFWSPRCSYLHQDIIKSHTSPPHTALVSLGKKLG